MRKIKFKGKSKMTIEALDREGFEHDNGWFIGNLITNGNKPFIVGDLVEVDQEYIVHEWWMPVYPESVGQYTGLKDKNGTEIYEGDMLKVSKEYSGKHNPVYVTFEDGSFRYQISHMHNPVAINEARVAVHEVIGNIYDNKHLLEGE